jgi:hypothetical protein
VGGRLKAFVAATRTSDDSSVSAFVNTRRAMVSVRLNAVNVSIALRRVDGEGSSAISAKALDA